jgi:hypothetical protein
MPIFTGTALERERAAARTCRLRRREGVQPKPALRFANAPVAQRKSDGLLSRWSEVRILPGASPLPSRNPLRQAGFSVSGRLSAVPLETAKNRSGLAPTGAKLAHRESWINRCEDCPRKLPQARGCGFPITRNCRKLWLRETTLYAQMYAHYNLRQLRRLPKVKMPRDATSTATRRRRNSRWDVGTKRARDEREAALAEKREEGMGDLRLRASIPRRNLDRHPCTRAPAALGDPGNDRWRDPRCRLPDSAARKTWPRLDLAAEPAAC